MISRISFEIDGKLAKLVEQGVIGPEREIAQAEHDIWTLHSRIRFGAGLNDAYTRVVAKAELEESWQSYQSLSVQYGLEIHPEIKEMYERARALKKEEDARALRILRAA